MVKTKHGIRYSPRPIADYAPVVDGQPTGVMQFYDDERNVATWNLLWLSVPEVDGYLTAPPEGFKEVTRSLPSLRMGLVLRAFIMDDKELFGSPPLAEMLRQLPPLEFMRQLRSRPYQDLCLYDAFGEEWMATMLKRAQLSEGGVDKPISESNVVQLRRVSLSSGSKGLTKGD